MSQQFKKTTKVNLKLLTAPRWADVPDYARNIAQTSSRTNMDVTVQNQNRIRFYEEKTKNYQSQHNSCLKY